MSDTYVDYTSRPRLQVTKNVTVDPEEPINFASIEEQQGWNIPTVKNLLRRRLVLGVFKAVAAIAPFAGFLAPLGGTGYGSAPSEVGFRGSMLLTVTLACFIVAALGQVWSFVEWKTHGQPKHRSARGAALVAIICSPLALLWLNVPGTMPPSDYAITATFIGITGLLAVGNLVFQLAGSTDRTAYESGRIQYGEILRALPEKGRQHLLAEREVILARLREEELITEAEATAAKNARLGDWWQLSSKK